MIPPAGYQPISVLYIGIGLDDFRLRHPSWTRINGEGLPGSIWPSILIQCDFLFPRGLGRQVGTWSDCLPDLPFRPSIRETATMLFRDLAMQARCCE